jgi:hypothetical protein
MASRHLITLKAMCLNADILGKAEQREALGWALARLNELTGSRIAAALAGRPSEAVAQELQQAHDRSEELDRLIDYICLQTRSDRKRLEAAFHWRESISGR